jgi:N-acyl-D-amino-acid deacylase
MKTIQISALLLFSTLILSFCNKPDFEVIIKNGNIIDGSGKAAIIGDIAINADTIAAIGNLSNKSAQHTVDATGLVVSPGFINILSFAAPHLIKDGRSLSDIKQGVTLEIFGEGDSMGPRMEKDSTTDTVKWITLNDQLEAMVEKGVSPNIASFVGATTLREVAVGFDDREPTAEEMELMKQLAQQAMEEGAMGVSSSLIYAPAFYSSTEELIELAKVAAQYDGLYISHIRSEGIRLLESLDELIRIAREAEVRAEIYHLKQSGIGNWHKLDSVIAKIESARAEGLSITADMYTYTAGSTGLTAAMPPWVQEGGYDKWVERLQNPEIRKRVLEDMRRPAIEWESLMQDAGSAENILLIGFKNDSLKHFYGKTLAEVAEIRGTSPEETVIDLVIEDGSTVEAIYFIISEENLRKQIALPWVSFSSDAGSYAAEGEGLKSTTHPRAYGNFARVLGKYSRDEGIIPLEEAIRKMTSLPAENLKLHKRGKLKPGYFADIAIFDANTIQDHATYEDPHQYATGMIHVFVNGTQVLKNTKHTGAMPGRVVKGPGRPR